MKLSFFVSGIPKPAGSKRVFLNRKTGKPLVTDASGKAGKDWRGDIKAVAIKAMEGFPLLTGPLYLQVDFVMPRPKGHYGKKGLKESAPDWHTSRPDLSKLTRALEDALTGIVWTDDAAIASQVIGKTYGESPGAKVVIGEL